MNIANLTLKYNYILPFIAKFPQRIAYRLASLYGKLQLSAHQQERQAIAAQMQRVFADTRSEQLEEWARYFYCMKEREFLDTFFFRKLTTVPQVDRFIRLVDYEPLLAARKEGKRVIITSGHYGRFWMAGVGLKAHGISVGVMARDREDTNVHGLPEAQFRYRRNKLRWLQQRFEGPFLAEGQAVRPFLRALDRHVMAIFTDVTYTHTKEGCIELPFLGNKGVFPIGTARMAKRANALIIPFYVNESRQGLEARFYPALEAEHMDEVEIMHQLIASLEQQILQHPAQWWLWQALPLFWK